MRSRVVAGSVLVVVGIITLAVTRLTIGGEIVPLIIGSAFMVWFAVTQSYGLLIPACILTGIGLGVVMESVYAGRNEPVVIGLGLGFIAIYAIDRLMGAARQGGWWPLIPGGILLVVGWQNLFYSQTLRLLWPVALVLIGLVLVFQGPRGASQAGGTRPGGPTGPET